MARLLTPTPPIFVIVSGGEDVSAFDTVVQAAGDMEPPEVTEGAYRVFDANGHEAELGIDEWDVIIKRWDDEPAPGQLRDLLLEYLATSGHRQEVDADLSDVVAAAERIAIETEEKRTHPKFAVLISRWLRNRRTEQR